MSYFTKNLKDEEELIRLIRRSPLTFVFSGFLTLVLFLLPFFLMFLLFRWKTAGLIIFTFLLVIGVLALIRLLVVWYYNCFLITNQRVILYKQKGLFNRKVSEVEYQKIQDLSYYFKGLGQSLFHYGTLQIQILSSGTIIKVEKIPQPQQVLEILKSIQKSKDLEAEELSDEELRKLAQTLKNKLGAEKLRNILVD